MTRNEGYRSFAQLQYLEILGSICYSRTPHRFSNIRFLNIMVQDPWVYSKIDFERILLPVFLLKKGNYTSLVYPRLTLHRLHVLSSRKLI